MLVLSGALVRSIDWESEVDHYKRHPYGVVAADVALSCAVVDSWSDAKIRHHKGFFREGPGHPECECNQLCTYGFGGDVAPKDQIISYHHIPGHRISELFQEHMIENVDMFKSSDIFCPNDNDRLCQGTERITDFHFG